jgi:hypothetical protein
MPKFDVDAFITKLGDMGMKLTAVPMADGKLKVYRWRMVGAFEHASEIDDFWKSQIGDDQARIAILASRLVSAAGAAPLAQRM